VTRNDVPDQKASIAVPPSLTVMIGRAIDREVASSAAARVIMHIETKARTNLRVGLNSEVTSSRGTCFSGCGEGLEFTILSSCVDDILLVYAVNIASNGYIICRKEGLSRVEERNTNKGGPKATDSQRVYILDNNPLKTSKGDCLYVDNERAY
jgi:hypothetical protein